MMKLLYRGGLNKYDSDGYSKSFFYEYTDVTRKLISKGKFVCYVTIAKPDHHYDEHILSQFGDTVDIIGRNSGEVDWEKYSLIFLCGGDTDKLKEGLLKASFSFDKLDKSVVILGDSAGSMVMSPFYYSTENRADLEFVEGMYPDTNTIVVVHVNNPKYCNPDLLRRIKEFAQDRNLEILKLKENETKLFDEGSSNFIDFDFEELVLNND